MSRAVSSAVSRSVIRAVIRASSRRGFVPAIVGLATGCCTGAFAAPNAPEIDRDAYWIEHTVCTVAIRLKADAAGPDIGRLLSGLVIAPASCAGNLAAPTPPPSVVGLLQRGFRIVSAQHQIVPSAPPPASTSVSTPSRDAEPTLLVTALFVLEKPAVRLPPIGK